MSEQIPPGRQKSGPEPEVTVEFLKTLPKGSRVARVTLPSDEGRIEAEPCSNLDRANRNPRSKHQEESSFSSDGLNRLDLSGDHCRDDIRLKKVQEKSSSGVKNYVESTIKCYWWLLLAVYVVAWVFGFLGISKIWTMGFFLAALTLFCFLESGTGGLWGLVKAIGGAIVIYLALAAFLLVVQSLIPLIFGVMGLTSIDEVVNSFGRL